MNNRNCYDKWTVITELLVEFAVIVISVITYALGKHLVKFHKILPWGAKVASCLNFNAAMAFGSLFVEQRDGKGDIYHALAFIMHIIFLILLL